MFFPNLPFVKTTLFPIKIFPAVFQNRIEKALHKNWENKHVSSVRQRELQPVRTLIALQGSKNHGEVPVNGTGIAEEKTSVFPCLILCLFLILFLTAQGFFFHFKLMKF